MFFMICYEQVKEKIQAIEKYPYPKVLNLYPNKRYAQMLYDDFGGDLGELSAITQYIYEHIHFEQQTDLSKIMLEIAIMEMRHLDLVGSIIQKLGEKPIYRDSKNNFWNAKNVKYDTGCIQETMTYNIETEKVAIQGYQKAIMYTNNISLKRLFERIIQDEKLHIEIFQKIREEC